MRSCREKILTSGPKPVPVMSARHRTGAFIGSWLAGLCTVLGMVMPASADIVIRGARIAEGDLWVLGQVDEPNTTISLDDSYYEKTDSRGRFEFRLGYHPATCTVVLKTARQSRAVVVANCGQRGPAGPEGPPGASAPVVAPAPPPNETPRLVVSCGLKAARYEAPNGFRVWITRKGMLRRPPSPQQDLVLQVSINGETASLRGSSYAAMMRGGPPREIEDATRQPINWERLVDALPETIEVVSDTGNSALARLTFRECGSAPRAARSSAPVAPDAERPDAPPPRPLPQGALPDAPPAAPQP